MNFGYQTWDAQLPTKPEAVQSIFGGLFKDSEDRIIPWSGTDPDSNINCFTWDTTLGNWICADESFDPAAPNKQGPVHPGQYYPCSVKEERKVREACVQFTGAKFNGISGSKEGKSANSYSVKT